MIGLKFKKKPRVKRIRLDPSCAYFAAWDTIEVISEKMRGFRLLSRENSRVFNTSHAFICDYAVSFIGAFGDKRVLIQGFDLEEFEIILQYYDPILGGK